MLLATASSDDGGREEIGAGRCESAGMRSSADENDDDDSTVRSAATKRWTSTTSLGIFVGSLTVGPWWSIIDPGHRNLISRRWISWRRRPNVLHRPQAIQWAAPVFARGKIDGVYSGSISPTDVGPVGDIEMAKIRNFSWVSSWQLLCLKQMSLLLKSKCFRLRRLPGALLLKSPTAINNCRIRRRQLLSANEPFWLRWRLRPILVSFRVSFLIIRWRLTRVSTKFFDEGTKTFPLISI